MFRKTNLPLETHKYVLNTGERNDSFSENFASVLNDLFQKLKAKLATPDSAAYTHLIRIEICKLRRQYSYTSV